VSSMYQAFVEVVPDASNLRRSLSREFDAAGPEAGRAAGRGVKSGVLGSVGKLAAPLAAAFAGLGIGKIIKDSIGNASDLAEAGTAITAVFGSADETIQKFAKGSAANLGQSTNETLDAARVFGVFGKAAGLGGEDLAGFSTDFLTLAGDLASFNNTTPEQAIQALGAGLRGESEPLRQYGVLLDDAALKARATEMGIYSGTGALTQQQKVLAAQAEIMAQTGTQQGDFAKTSGGLANQQRILSAGLENLSTTFGAIFLPIATTVVGFLNRDVVPAFQGLADMLAGGGLADMNFGQLIIDAFMGVSAWLTGGGIESIFSTLSESRAGFLGAMLQALPGIVDAIVQIIPIAITALLGFISGGVELLVGAAPQILAAAIGLFGGIVGGLLASLPIIIQTIVGLIPVLLATAVQLFTAIVAAIPLILPPLLAGLIALIPVLITAILGMIPQILDSAVQLFTSLVQALPVILPMLITAIVDLLPVLITSILGMIPLILEAAINLFTALVESLPVILPLLITAILGLLPVILKSVVGMIPQLLEAAFSLFESLITAVPKIIPELIPALLGLLPVMVSTIIGLVPELIKAGGALIGGLIKGIIGSMGAVGDAVGGVMDFIGGFFPHSPAKRGPFSGAGWRAIGDAGLAIGEEFSSGLSNSVTDVALSSLVSVPDMSNSIDASVGTAGSQSHTTTPMQQVTEVTQFVLDGKVLFDSQRTYVRGLA